MGARLVSGEAIALYPKDTIFFSSKFMQKNGLGKMTHIRIVSCSESCFKVIFCKSVAENNIGQYRQLYAAGKKLGMARRATLATFLRDMGIPRTRTTVLLKWKRVRGEKRIFWIFFEGSRQRSLALRILEEVRTGILRESSRPVLPSWKELKRKLKPDFPDITKEKARIALGIAVDLFKS